MLAQQPRYGPLRGYKPKFEKLSVNLEGKNVVLAVYGAKLFFTSFRKAETEPQAHTN